MRDRMVRLVWLAVPPVAGGVVAALWWPGVEFLVLAPAFAVSHLLTIPNASGRSVSVAPAVAAVTTLLSGGSLVLVLGAAAVALPVSWSIVQLLHGSRVAGRMVPAEHVGMAVMVGSFAAAVQPLASHDPSDPAVLGVFAGAALAGFAATIGFRVATSKRRRVVTARLVALQALSDWSGYAALVSSAALFAVTFGALGFWSAPLAGLPYLFSYVSLHRLQITRRTYDQTIRALGAIPEASGQVSAGHSGRTADLAVALGAEIGLGTGGLQRVEYAALLHDIGRVVLSNPAVATSEHTFADVSQWSAAIIGEARLLEQVASVVATQHAPYRKEGQVRDEAVPRASQVLRIAARFDSAVSGGSSAVEAVEVLHRGSAYDYDPQIVAALRRVLQRRGVIAA